MDKLIEAEHIREATDADLWAVERPNFFTDLQEANDDRQVPLQAG